MAEAAGTGPDDDSDRRLRAELADALGEAMSQIEQGNDADLAAAVRSAARAATQLARAPERS